MDEETLKEWSKCQELIKELRGGIATLKKENGLLTAKCLHLREENTKLLQQLNGATHVRK